MATDALAGLGELLAEARAFPRRRVQQASSELYDPTYRVAVLALALQVCGKASGPREITLAGQKAQLFQFVAVHRQLLPDLVSWVHAQGKHGKETWEDRLAFPKGYATDPTYAPTLAYLLAAGDMSRRGNDLVLHRQADGAVDRLLVDIEQDDAFAAEREALQRLSGLSITLKMLDNA